MNGIDIQITINGDKDLAARLNSHLADGPKRRFLTRSAFLIEGRAKVNASKNIDTGTGVNSIQTSVSADSATVGTNEEHMLYLHEGTRPHFPPIAAVTPWALRHGIDPFLVALGISRHGTKANPFLRDAFDQSVGDINGFVGDMAREIERELGG